jgi:hypothetical protein
MLSPFHCRSERALVIMPRTLNIKFLGGVLCLLLSPSAPLHAQAPDLPNLPPFPQHVSVQQQLKRLAEEQKATWEWILNWKWLLVAIVLVLVQACRSPAYSGKPVESRKMRPVFFVMGGIVACAGATLYLFAMSAEDHPLLPFVGAGVVVVGLALCLPGLPVSNTRTRQ